MNQIKMFPRSSMHNVLLNSFQNLFKISKLECVKCFFQTPSINYSGPGQKSVVTCFWKIHGGSCPVLVFLGELFREKCPESPEDTCPALEEISRRAIFQGGTTYG